MCVSRLGPGMRGNKTSQTVKSNTSLSGAMCGMRWASATAGICVHRAYYNERALCFIQTRHSYNREIIPGYYTSCWCRSQVGKLLICRVCWCPVISCCVLYVSLLPHGVEVKLFKYALLKIMPKTVWCLRVFRDLFNPQKFPKL